MSEKKVVRRSVAISLGIICIVLIAGLVGAIAYYTMNTTSNTTYNDYISTHSHTNTEYDAMWSPYLTKVDLGATQHSGFLSSPYLNVRGYIVNVHKNWAYNCKLHVVAYQAGGVTAIDTYIDLGTMAGESSIKVDSNINYVAGDITSYTITPQWTATP
jgi:predicted PurR-regulated permease PerM